jgi:D-arabinose 1-dehydrogenase-like Zn-dependent alcohol dehydrogenase
LKIPGISYDGGYEQYMVAPVEALVPIPEGLSDVEAAPLLCAGITTYTGDRRSWAPRHSIREQVRLQDSGNRTRL